MKDSESELVLQQALQRAALLNRRYLYFASLADIEGHNEAASLFRQMAEAETGHAFGLLEHLQGGQGRDLIDGQVLTGDTLAHLRSVCLPEAEHNPCDLNTMAKTVKKEGHGKAAEWLETLAKTAKQHCDKAKKLLAKLEQAEEQQRQDAQSGD